MKNVTSFLLCLAMLLSLPAGVAGAAEYNLSLNLPIPPIHNRWTKALKPWFDELERRSGGRIKVEPFFAEAISKQSESMDSVRDGLADFAESAFGVAVGQFPFHERAFDLLDLSMSLERPNTILHEMQKSFPQVMQECRGVKLLFTHSLPVGLLLGTKTPVTSLKDIKDQKIAVIGGGITADRLKALGASVVSLPVIDIYMALEQGVVDGSTVDFQLLTSRRFGDIVKHVTLLPLVGGTFYCCMRQDLYDEMPPDLQKIIDDMSGAYAEKLFEDFWNKDQYESVRTWMDSMGGQLHLLTDEEYARANEMVRPVDQEWIDALNKSGLPGKEMLARFRELERQYDKPWKESRMIQFVNK